MKRAKPVYLDAGRVGIWKATGGACGRDVFTYFRVPLLTKGAIGSNGCGHCHILGGIRYHWGRLNDTWAVKRGLRLFGLVSFIHEDDKKGTLRASYPGLRVKWPEINLRVRAASEY